MAVFLNHILIVDEKWFLCYLEMCVFLLFFEKDLPNCCCNYGVITLLQPPRGRVLWLEFGQEASKVTF